MHYVRFLSILMTLPIISGLKSGELDTRLAKQTESSSGSFDLTSASPLSFSNEINPFHLSFQHFTALEQSPPLFYGKIDLVGNEYQSRQEEILKRGMAHQKPSSDQSNELLVPPEITAENQDPAFSDDDTLEMIIFIEDTDTDNDTENGSIGTRLSVFPKPSDVPFAAPFRYVNYTDDPSFRMIPVSLLGNWFIHEESAKLAYLSEKPRTQRKSEVAHDKNAPAPAAVSAPAAPSEMIAAQVESTPTPKKTANANPPKTTQLQQPAIKPLPPAKKQRDLFPVEVGAVYLRPYQGGTDFAQKVDLAEVIASSSEPYGTNQGLDFEFEWGVRVGLGYENAEHRQAVKATYLYLAASAHKSTNSDYTGDVHTANSALLTTLIDVDLGAGAIGDLLESAESNWNLHFNMLDLSFGKKYPQKGCMSFEPFIGVKGILLSENQKSNYASPTKKGFGPVTTIIGTLEQKVDFQGIGVMGGFNLDWAFTRWLSFIGSIDAAYLYSSIHTKRTSNNTIPSLLWIGSSHDVKGTGVLEGSFALKGVYCWKSGRYIDLKVGFEEHYIFEVMKHAVLNSDSSTDLSLMGWFATLGFGF